MKLFIRKILLILLMISISLISDGQKQSRKVRQAEKKMEKAEKQKKKDYEKARKKSNKHKFKIQPKSSQEMIKNSRKETKRNNRQKKDCFITRPFKKRKARK